jgi:hypothetical protein
MKIFGTLFGKESKTGIIPTTGGLNAVTLSGNSDGTDGQLRDSIER